MVVRFNNFENFFSKREKAPLDATLVFVIKLSVQTLT